MRRKAIRRRQETVQREIQGLGNKDAHRLVELLQEKERLKRALMDPSLAESGSGAVRNQARAAPTMPRRTTASAALRHMA